MNIDSIQDIFAQREKVRLDLVNTLSGLDRDHLDRSEPGGWTVEYIIEHVAITESGISKIIERLIGKCREDARPPSDGPIISDRLRSIFANAGRTKAEAPEMVRPSGSMTAADALHSLDGSSARLRELFADADKFDLSGHTFPHPYFGELTAAEWFAVLAFHEMRHLAQIRRALGS